MRKLPSKIKGYMRKLIEQGYQAYVIGGAVRDMLLKRNPNDYDIFTDATGEQILEIFPEGNIIGNEERQAKILTVVVDGVEISQFRKNGERTEVGHSLEKHQDTCDFTINAMAMDVDGNIIDRHRGQEDLKVRTLCFVGVPLDRIKEDPLRILRGIRFWSRFRAMKFEDLSVVLENIDLLDTLPKERIREEFLKIIRYPSGIENLWCDGIIYKIFPELEKVVGMKGGDFHDEVVDEHMKSAFRVACTLTDNTLLRMAIFLHDIGKGFTYTEEVTNEVILSKDGSPMLERVMKQTHFYEHEKVGADLVEKKMEGLKFSKEEIKYVNTLIRLHMYSYKSEPQKKSYIKFFNRLDEAKVAIEDYIMLIYCDHQGNQAKPRIKFGDFIKGNWLYKKYFEIKYSEEPMTVKDLKVSGKDVMDIFKIGPGEAIGEILKKVFDEVMDGNLKNNRADLLNYLKEAGK